MKIEVGQPFNYHLMYGRVSSIEGDTVYFATPHGSRYKATERLFYHMSSDIKEDNVHLKEFEQKAIDAGVELYGGFIPEFTRASLASRYCLRYGCLYDRKEQQGVYSGTDILRIIRELEANARSTL